MLVLSRKINESIQIGTDVEVTVIDVRGDVVRLGINAPQKTQIWRKELWDVIVEENRAAAKAARVDKNLPQTVPTRSCPYRPSRSFPRSGPFTPGNRGGRNRFQQEYFKMFIEGWDAAAKDAN